MDVQSTNVNICLQRNAAASTTCSLLRQYMNGKANKQANKQTNQQTNKQANKQINEQTNKHQQKESNKNIITDQFQFQCRGFEILVASRCSFEYKILKSHTKPAGYDI